MQLERSSLNRFKVNTSLFILLSVVTSGSHGAELSSFVADTISAHPDVREQVHIFRQNIQDKEIAKSGWRPSVDLSASFGTFESESPVTGPDSISFESSRAELSVTQNLYNGFDTKHQVSQTDARVNSALFEIYDTADNIALEATQSYLEVLKQQRLYELAIKNVESHEDILEQIRIRSLSGVGRRSQLEQTEGRVASAHASLIAQQNNLQDAATQFHQVAGRYVDPATLVEPELPKHPGLSIEDLTAQALASHPALQVANFNIQAAQADYRRSRSKNQPIIDLRLAKEIGEDINGLDGSTDDLSLVLNLNYNLYRGGADRATRKQKISVIHELEQFAARTRRQVINTLRLSWAADQSLSKQLAFLQEHVVKSEATLSSYREEFFIGQRDLINVLDAENELNSSQNNYTEAYFNYLAARFRMYEGVGSLFESLNLDAKITDQDLQISLVQAQGEDILPYNIDRDKDQVINPTDHCDNSRKSSVVDSFGCGNQPEVDFDQYQSFNGNSGDGNSRAFAIQNNADVEVKAVNTAPVTVDDELDLVQDSILTIASEMLLSNDSDAESDNLFIKRYSQPTYGKLALDTNKNLIYRPDEGYLGKDKFTYTVSDGKGKSSTAVVNLNISSEDGVDFSQPQFVNFLFNDTALTNGSATKVKSIISMLKQSPDIETWIFAHTDDVGTASYNLALSKRRANALRDLLVSNGISDKRIKANGIGENKPMADNATKPGRAINRRGEFHFRENLSLAAGDK